MLRHVHQASAERLRERGGRVAGGKVERSHRACVLKAVEIREVDALGFALLLEFGDFVRVVRQIEVVGYAGLLHEVFDIGCALVFVIDRRSGPVYGAGLMRAAGKRAEVRKHLVARIVGTVAGVCDIERFLGG